MDDRQPGGQQAAHELATAAQRAAVEVAGVSTGSWSAMAPRLGLRLELAAGAGLGIELGPGIRVGVVAELRHAVLTVGPELAETWRRPPAAVVARARRNTLAAPVQVHRAWFTLSPDGPEGSEGSEGSGSLDGPGGPGPVVEVSLVAGGWSTTGRAADLADLVPAAALGWGLLVAPGPTSLVVATTGEAPAPDRQRALAHRLGALARACSPGPAPGRATAVIRCHPGGKLDIFTILG